MRHVKTPVVIEEPNVWIPMSDGTRLAARIWRPTTPAPVPAILEYLPYRKRYGTVARDSLTHPYLASHGYASVRVDLRGSGESDGILTDEYLQTELDDGVETIDWIASQPWCDGNVGMMGISWGGFNGLQIAALQPEPLKAIMTICSTDDRYADDIHHMGGCLLADNLSWSSVMFALNTMPPDPSLVGERWREMWFERLEGSGLWLDTWLRHQRRDAYWRHGSICEDYSAIRCPVYAVSGWADGYSNAVFRLLEQLDVPRKGLVGPWSHAYPHIAGPGPAIGFLQELLRWWDHWLKGIDTGVMDEPMVRAWMQEAVSPAPAYEARPGRWVAEETWPAPRIGPLTLRLDTVGGLVDSGAGSTGTVTVSSPLWVGRHAGKWCSYGDGPDQPGDQAADDGGSVVFDTAPLSQAVEILGAPVVELAIASDRPVSQVAVRLCSVDPAGRSTRVTYGVLNLTHRASHAEPEPLEPGRPARVTVRLNDVGQAFPVGHRIRLAVSSSYWPLIWPAPESSTLTIDCSASTLTLPVRPDRTDDRLPAFPEPEGASPETRTTLRAARNDWRLHHDLGTDAHSLEVIDDSGRVRLDDIGLEVDVRAVERYSSVGDDPTSVRGEVTTERTMARDEWEVHTVTTTVLSSTREVFVLDAELVASEGGEEVFRRAWHEEIPRDMV